MSILVYYSLFSLFFLFISLIIYFYYLFPYFQHYDRMIRLLLSLDHRRMQIPKKRNLISLVLSQIIES